MNIREEFREYLRESKSQDDIIEILQDLVGTDKKVDEYMWDFFEKNIPSIYAGDATPEDYLEELSKKSNARLATKLYDALKSKFNTKLNEGRIKTLTKWENFVSKSIDGTGGFAYLFTNGEWENKPTHLPTYFKEHPKKSVMFKQSGVRYEWILDTGYITYL